MYHFALIFSHSLLIYQIINCRLVGASTGFVEVNSWLSCYIYWWSPVCVCLYFMEVSITKYSESSAMVNSTASRLYKQTSLESCCSTQSLVLKSPFHQSISSLMWKKYCAKMFCTEYALECSRGTTQTDLLDAVHVHEHLLQKVVPTSSPTSTKGNSIVTVAICGSHYKLACCKLGR